MGIVVKKGLLTRYKTEKTSGMERPKAQAKKIASQVCRPKKGESPIKIPKQVAYASLDGSFSSKKNLWTSVSKNFFIYPPRFIPKN